MARRTLVYHVRIIFFWIGKSKNTSFEVEKSKTNVANGFCHTQLVYAYHVRIIVFLYPKIKEHNYLRLKINDNQIILGQTHISISRSNNIFWIGKSKNTIIWGWKVKNKRSKWFLPYAVSIYAYHVRIIFFFCIRKSENRIILGWKIKT